MEIIESITSVISTVGFPIAMCLLMWWQNNETIDQIKELVNKISGRLDQIDQRLDDIEDKIN